MLTLLGYTSTSSVIHIGSFVNLLLPRYQNRIRNTELLAKWSNSECKTSIWSSQVSVTVYTFHASFGWSQTSWVPVRPATTNASDQCHVFRKPGLAIYPTIYREISASPIGSADLSSSSLQFGENASGFGGYCRTYPSRACLRGSVIRECFEKNLGWKAISEPENISRLYWRAWRHSMWTRDNFYLL